MSSRSADRAEQIVHHARPYRSQALDWRGTSIGIYEPVVARARPAESLVLIHGLGDTWDVWEELAWALAPTVRVFCVDLPWSARNYRRQPTAAPGVWLRRIMRRMPSGPVSVVAHSFGADVLLSYLGRYGAAGLHRLVFVSPFYQASAETFTWSTLTYFVDQFTAFLRSGLTAREPKYEGTAVADLMAERVRDKIGPEGWLQFFTLFAATPYLPLSSLSLPVLVVGGAQDTASIPQYSTDLGAAFRHGSSHIIDNCGHVPMLQQPESFNALVADFLLAEAQRQELGAARLGGPLT